MLNIRHERPDAATSFEVKAPLTIIVSETETLDAVGLSLEGVRLKEPVPAAPRDCLLLLPFQGFDISVPVRFREYGPSDFLAFAPLSSRSHSMIRLFHEGLVSGRMATAVDMITSLDTPVDLIPMGETDEEAERSSAKTSPRWLRAFRSIFFYLLVAAALGLTLGERAWNRLNSVPVDGARVAAPTEESVAHANGFVVNIAVEPGQVVQAGDLLVSVSDPDQGATIERTRAAITLLERRLEEVDAALARLDEETRERRRLLVERLHAAWAARTIRDFLSHYNMEEVEAATRALAEFDARENRADRAGRYTDLLERKIELETDLALLRRELGTQKARSKSADIIAESDGVVREIAVRPGQYLTRGMPVATIETEALRFVRGMIAHDRASSVYLGMPGHFTIRTADGDRTFQARVAEFEPLAEPQTDPTVGQPVRLEPVGLEIEETREVMQPGTPVSAWADRELWNRAKAWWQSFVAPD